MWDGKIVECHPMEVWILYTIKEPPFKGVLDLLDRMLQVLI